MTKLKTIKIDGKDFVLHEGLLAEFHANGGKGIHTELLSSEDNNYIFKATVNGAKGEYTAHGDATPDNVSDLVAEHHIRCAETRAVNRALRFYNNIGMCSVDELGSRNKPQTPLKSPKNNVYHDCKDGGRIVFGEKNNRTWYRLDDKAGNKVKWMSEDEAKELKFSETPTPDVPMPPDYQTSL